MRLILLKLFLLTVLARVQSQGSLDSVRLAPSVIVYDNEAISDSLQHSASAGIGYHLSYKKIKAQNTASIDEVLRLIPAVHVKNYGGLGGLKTISVRGLGAQHSGLLINGNLISDQKSGQIDLSIVPVQSITSIEFNIGDLSSVFSPAKAYTYNNTLSVEESLDKKLGSKAHQVVLGSGVGSFSSYNPFLQLTHRLDSNCNLGVVYEGLFSQGNYPYFGIDQVDKKRKNNDFGRNTLKLLFEQKNDSSEVNLQAFVLNKKQNLPGAEVLGNPNNNQQLDQTDLFVLGSKVWKGDSYDLFVRGNVDYQYTHYLDTNYQNQNGVKSSYYNQFNTTGSVGVTKYIGDLLGFLVTDLEYNYLSSNNISGDVNRVSNYLTAGAEYLLGSFKFKGFITNSIISNSGQSKSIRNNLSGFIGLNFEAIPEKLYAKIFYKSSFRMPSFNDLYYNNIGNEELEPEQSDQINIAFSSIFKLGFLEKVGVNINSFYGVLNNKIVAVPTQNLFIWSMQNIGKVRNFGGELSFNLRTKRFAKHLALVADFGYTLQQNRDITDKADVFYGDQIRYTPQEIINSRLTFEYKKYLSVFWNGQHIGHQFYLPQNTYDNLINSVLTHEVGVNYKLLFKRFTTICQLSIRNLTNEDYQLVRSFPMQGRNVWGTLTFVI